jgi:hypothetical protein
MGWLAGFNKQKGATTTIGSKKSAHTHSQNPSG